MDFSNTVLTVVSSVAILVAMAGLALLRHRRQRRDTAVLARTVSAQLHIPASLHPVIDTEICIGSLSCISACNEGDVLGIVNGAATLIQGGNCIGHGSCAADCPVGAIKLVFGTSERGVDLPRLDDHFESSRPGVHVVGELGGMGLIRNAVIQGLEAAQYIAESLRGARAAAAGGGAVDVAIIGGGPAGLATALGCRSRGLTFRVLEQGTLGGTIGHYPRQKVVMTEKVELPLVGKFGKRHMTKEELLEAWQKVVTRADIRVNEGVRVTAVEGQDGAFRVATDKGEVAARKVVLATGRRGTPRRLGVPGEDLPKVTYRLIDPEQYAGARVLVVGGGDAALEAASMLAEETDAAVTLAYRGAAFGKCRESNRRKVAALAESGRLPVLMSTDVRAIEPEHVVLTSADVSRRLPNDYVIVCAGGELPLEFLKTLRVDLERHHGQKAVRHAGMGPQGKAAIASHKHDERPPVSLAAILFAVGALIIAALAWVGADYYVLPHDQRAASPLHASLKSAGNWGHGVGIVATLFMLSNFTYSLRKRWRRLKGGSSIRPWLTVHMFVGFMSPAVIAFHAAFQSRNLLATATFASLMVVVGAGIIGRFLYGLVPSVAGRAAEHATVLARWERLKREVEPLVAQAAQPERVRALLAPAAEMPRGGSLALALLSMPVDAVRGRLALLAIRRLFTDGARWREARRCFLELRKLRVQARFYASLRRLMSAWRIVHVVLAVFLVVIMTGHIGISLYLGYRWMLP